jgi:hypothetical protein
MCSFFSLKAFVYLSPSVHVLGLRPFALIYELILPITIKNKIKKVCLVNSLGSIVSTNGMDKDRIRPIPKIDLLNVPHQSCSFPL